jgi:uridine kinase/ribulose-5-phosphate 4-epimerase/fuculose-1-phosphate aldolase
MSFKPFIIGIAGESGVGKSTISGIISLFYADMATVISTDDLHKWERNNPAWKTITHLHPDANNLDLGDSHLYDLSQGHCIYRSIYNHKTGTFDPPVKVEPKPVIVNEGLHAYYTTMTQKITSLKVYVDTEEQLRTHWKLIRDTEERGYRYNDVLDIIEKRRADSNNIRKKQLLIADVVICIRPRDGIKTLGDKHEIVPLVIEVHSNDKTPIALMTFIKQYMSDFGDFIKASEIVGHEVEMCQNGGGNISVKSNDFMIIKASGFNMKDVHRLSGYSVLKHDNLRNNPVLDEVALNSVLTKAAGKYKRPSMETGMHVLLRKYVLHAHPVYATLLLSLQHSHELITGLYADVEHHYVPYVNPGFDLYNTFRNVPRRRAYFLENHGIVVTGDELDPCLQLLFEINNRAKQYISEHCEFEPFSLSYANREALPLHPFPDSVMFLHDTAKKETIAAHNYINTVGSRLGRLRHLSQHDIAVLRGMESEKYRLTV